MYRRKAKSIINGTGSVEMTKSNATVELAPSKVSTFRSTDSIPMLYSFVVKKEIVQNVLCDKVPANTFCSSVSNEQFVYSSDEFPVLPSKNAFLSLPTVDSVYFTSPACSFASILNKPVTSLTQPLLSQTVSTASLQFPHCSLPITSQALLSSLISSLPIPTTESELSTIFPKPLPQCSCFMTSSQAPLSNLILSFSPPTAESELFSTSSKPLPQHSQSFTSETHFPSLCLPCLYLLQHLNFLLHFLCPYLIIPSIQVYCSRYCPCKYLTLKYQTLLVY
ncbi:hypothetical protein AVEN_9841-1 [Araneus ventricosus]|uniref:Uncharacterized protein n=1 Tax=Araneus ventricosus TaxID=182803 RepID=A0A4Y2ESS4_ARAVE|nr:hypothetical protein AVEN_9841-1 [Araneus ventricosus]